MADTPSCREFESLRAGHTIPTKRASSNDEAFFLIRAADTRIAQSIIAD